VLAPNEMRLVDPTPPRQPATSTATVVPPSGSPATDAPLAVDLRFASTLTGIPVADGEAPEPPAAAPATLPILPAAAATHAVENPTQTLQTPTSEVLALPMARRRRSWVILAVAAVAGCIAIAAYTLRESPMHSSEAAPVETPEQATTHEDPGHEQPAPPVTHDAPLAEPAAAAEEPIPAPTPPTPAPAAPVATAPSHAAPADARPHAPREPAATGLVSLDTTPWSRVYFHGRLLGETPLAEVRLPAGRQILVCVDGEDRRHNVTVVVDPNQVVRRRVAF